MKTKALEASALALSTAALGRGCNDSQLVYESGKFYVHGLSGLQKALQNPRLVYDDETLAACLTLSLYELMECPAKGRNAYASHCKGILALVQRRGPRSHTFGLGRQLFLGMRLQGVCTRIPKWTGDRSNLLLWLQILYAMENHSPTYLAEPAWMQMPWAESAKRPFDRVVDCLAHAPEILKETDKLRHLRPMEQLVLANKVVSQCWDLDWALQKCYEELQLAAIGPLYWPTLSRNEDPTGVGGQGKLFPVAYEFPDVQTASTLMMYWASVVMLWSGLCNLYQLIDSIINHESTEERQSHDLPSLEHRTDFLSTAWHVCRSVEYCMQKEMMTLGTLVASTPLAIVLETLRDHPHCRREVAWMRAAMDQLRDRGLRFFEYVRL